MKKINLLFILVFSLSALSCYSQKYVFYLHGRIVEVQGPNAVDTINGYGAYRYFDIIDSLKKKGFNVISEVRKPNTDVKEYAKVVSKQIDSLLKQNIKPRNITVIGASKGAIIAMYVSTLLKNSDINYVFMGACYDNLYAENKEIMFCGNILSIYEKSDYEIGRSCKKLKDRSNSITNYKEIEINTGLRHGFIYRPIKEWMEPTSQWINNYYK